MGLRMSVGLRELGWSVMVRFKIGGCRGSQFEHGNEEGTKKEVAHSVLSLGSLGKGLIR